MKKQYEVPESRYLIRAIYLLAQIIVNTQNLHHNAWQAYEATEEELEELEVLSLGKEEEYAKKNNE